MRMAMTVGVGVAMTVGSCQRQGDGCWLVGGNKTHGQTHSQAQAQARDQGHWLLVLIVGVIGVAQIIV